ncbi:response regulator [Desulforhopalus vacuolatus]|uniref:response regulator n=1 Tax=Desulforhopalus vacuolatus TaxID=40414 RepID=UPI00196283AA|nr:response regulator [Desulforhopalus vacuolatus]MBM9519197.1 response regulator [Desulforhopalus vacuolatus]
MKKILLVDDEQDFREISGKFLAHRGFDTLQADSCATALDLLAQEADNVDVIIMDVSMPGKDGIACMAEVKATWPQLEVIILTGHASLSVSITGMKKGAFDYCMKPVDFDEMLEKIALAREKAARGE